MENKISHRNRTLSPELRLKGALLVGILEATKHSQERHKQMLLNIIKQMVQPYRTPFEQAAYDIQYRKPNRVSGPDLGSSLTPDISETVSDRDLLLAGILLAAFIILLVVV